MAVGVLVAPASPWAQQITSWLLAEFMLGGVVAWVFLNHRERTERAAPWLLACGVLWLIAGGLLTDPDDHFQRLVGWGIPSAMVVAAAAVGDWSRLPAYRSWLVLGQASYSIYLIQVFVLPGQAMILRRFGLSALVPIEVSMLILTLASAAAGVAFWWCVEMPIQRYLNNRLRAASTPLPASTPSLRAA
jgi:peptidoglycan/LPS O-acetylase OafA/YrhL